MARIYDDRCHLEIFALGGKPVGQRLHFGIFVLAIGEGHDSVSTDSAFFDSLVKGLHLSTSGVYANREFFDNFEKMVEDDAKWAYRFQRSFDRKLKDRDDICL
jgi:hypothetical protein